MNDNYEEYEIDLREYIELLFQRKWLIIILVLMGGIAGYLYTSNQPPIYKANALLMLDESSSGYSDLEKLTLNNEDKELQTYSRLFKTRKLLKKVVNTVDDEDLSSQGLESSLSVSILPNTNLIKISITNQDPKLAKTIIEVLISEFVLTNRELKKTSTSSARDYVSTQLEQVSQELKEYEDEVKEYQKENSLTVMSDFDKKLTSQIIDLEKRIAAANIDIQTHIVSLDHLKDELEKENEEILSSKTISRNNLVENIKNKLVEVERKLSSLNSVYTDKHPDVKKLKSERDNLQKQLNNKVKEIVSSSVYTDNPVYNQLHKEFITLEGELLSLKAEKEGLELQLEEQMKEINKLPEKELEYSRLQRNLKVTEELYTMLLTRHQELKITEAMKVSDIMIVDPPVVPEKAIGPNKKLNVVIALVLSFMFSIFLVFLLEFLNFTIQKPEELEDLTDAPVIGHIPDISEHLEEDD